MWTLVVLISYWNFQTVTAIVGFLCVLVVNINKAPSCGVTWISAITAAVNKKMFIVAP